MSDTPYISAKVREAVLQAKGDPVTAQRLLIAACGRDDRLLRGLVAPFIKGIVAHAVQKVAASAAPAARGPKKLTAQALDDVIGQLGQRIGSKAEPQGMTALINPPTRPTAGEGHQKSLRQLAAAFARKRLEQR